MSSGYQEPVGGTASPSTGTAVGSQPIRALLKVLRNIDITAEPGYGSTFIPKIKTPFEILSTALRLQNPAQTFYTNIESAALLANQSIKIPIITATESGNKKDELVFLKQAQSLENKTFPTFFDVTETAAPANPSAGTLRIYANSTTHELTQRNSAGTEVKLSDGSGGGGGGAPSDAQYLTLGVNATLTGERVLTGSGRISITDAGPGVTATLDIPTGSIVDSYIGSHTSSKISITTKGQLNSNIVYTDQANTWGATAQTFAYDTVRIQNSGGTFYSQLRSAATANRTPSLPDNSGTIATNDSTTTFTNKTYDATGTGNTLSNVGDSNIASHTSTKVSITAKGQLNSQIAYKDENNWITNSHVADGTFNWTKVSKTGSILDDIADVVITSVASQDVIHRNGSSQWVNLAKGANNTFLGVNGSGNLAYSTVADANIASHTSTKITITSKSQLNSSILYSDVDNALGSHYVDVTEIAAPSNPSAGVLRIYANSTTHELTQRDSSGTERKFSDGSGGAGAPTNVPYLTLASDATLTSERVATASTRVTITDAGVNSTATFDIGSGSIVDAYIGSHTSTKISITAKGQLNSAIVYNDQANSFGDFAQTFKDNQLKINNPADTFAYTIVAAAIGANRNLTLPLLTGNDTAVAEAFSQTLTNKTINFSNNSGSNIGDSAIAAHTSTKITITTKGQLNSNILYGDQNNTLGANYLDITERAAPSNPGAGVLRVYANSTTHELTQRDSSGTEKNFSTGSGGGGITASSTDTLTNKTISRTTNILPYTSPTKYSVYKDGGVVKVANNEDGSVNSYATLGPAINAVLADTSQPSCEVASGTYNLASDFSAWVIVPKFKFYTKGLVIINVPQNYAGRVFSIQNSAADVYYVEIDGETAIWDEQGTQTNDWIWLGISPTGNKAVHNCKFRNTDVWRATVPLYLKTTDNSWINQNTFENIYGTACKYLTTFDFVGTYTQDLSGCNGNRFVNVSMQATGADPTEHYPQALGGIIGVNGDYNTFEDCNVWDLAAANSSAVSMSITSVSRGTRIDGGILTHRFFDDQGTGTIITDYWKGIHNKGPTTLAGTNTLSGATTISGNLTVSGTANFTNTAGLTAKYLGITTPAIASDGEDLFSFTVADASGDSFVLTNSSAVDGTFCPLFRSTQNSTAVGTGTIGLYFEAMVKASTDTAGANWCNAVSGRRLDGNPMTTRGLFAVTNKFDTEYGFYPTYLDMVDNFIEMTEIAAPANPAAGKLRMWADSTSHEWSQKNSSGTVVKMSDGSGGGGAPTGAQYLTLATDGTLTSERVATASSRVTITDAGAGSTATFDIGSGSIVDAYIGSHTSTKISITAKGQLNSSIVYTDQANTWGAFNQIFPTSRLLIGDSDASHQYVIAGGNLTGANRTITLPALTGNDVAVTEAFSQNLSNKTMYGAAWRVVSKSSDVTAAADEVIIPVSASGANRTITLPAASSSLGKIYVFQKSDSSTNTVTIQRAGSDTINGATTFVLTSQYQTVTLFCDTTSSWATNPNSSERTGKAVASGNGSQTAFTISHGLGATPSNVFVDCSSHAIARTFTVDSTTITVTFSSAPSSGTNNVIIYWRVVA